VKIVIPSAKRIKPKDHTIISFEVADERIRSLVHYMFENEKSPFYRLTIQPPRRARTTGWKSQNHHLNGHIQQIAMATGNSFSAVKERMKELAIDRGYPVEILPDGSVKPKSESEITSIEAGYLIDTIHQFAAEWEIPLAEE